MRHIPFVLLSLVLAVPTFAAKHRAVVTAPQPEAVLSIEVVDAETGAPVVDVEANSFGAFARSNRAGRLAVSIPVGRAIPVTFERAGYETKVETFNISAAAERKVSLVAKPTIQITTTNGTKYELDNGSLQIGYPEPFLGFRLSSELKACRAGGGEVVLSSATVRRLTGPATTAADRACCATGTAQGLDAELASGERVRVYFLESCPGNKMHVAGRDHVSRQLVAVAVTELAEVIVR